MSDIPGTKKPDLVALPKIRDRMSFLYLEHCIVNRQDGAITVTDIRGTVHVPASSLTILLLGPGTSISHRTMELISNSGTSLVWVGEQGVRYYAHGHHLTFSSKLLIRQAELVTNTKSRIAVARKMYQKRFENEDVSSLTMQQLRGREGSRIRSLYRRMSKETGVKWNGREYNSNDFASGDPVNKALSAAHACLYGVVQSVIVALGCSPGLGFVHTGHVYSFVYDIADLYKADITIPISFQVAAENPEDIGSVTRRRVRDAIKDGNILKQAVIDIQDLLAGEEDIIENDNINIINLWDDKLGFVANAVSYGKTGKADELEEGYGKILEE